MEHKLIMLPFKTYKSLLRKCNSQDVHNNDHTVIDSDQPFNRNQTRNSSMIDSSSVKLHGSSQLNDKNTTQQVIHQSAPPGEPVEKTHKHVEQFNNQHNISETNREINNQWINSWEAL
jgi:hypothetical protein